MLSPLKKQSADICLILEDGYPYRQGGEASWVHYLVSAMPRVKFAIVHIGTNRYPRRKRGLKYKLPRNVTTVANSFIFEESNSPAFRNARPDRRSLHTLTDAILKNDFNSILESITKLSQKTDLETFLKNSTVQDAIVKLYERNFAGEPYADFAINFSEILSPVWKLAHDFSQLPAANSYHCIGTGYAGLMGVFAKLTLKKPLLISEQSISVRERIGEQLRAQWTDTVRQKHSILRHLWIDFFMMSAQISYENADRITTPFQKNVDHQVEFGAQPDKVSVIRNGIELSRFESVRRERIERLRVNPNRKNIGFLGRISRQKDLKTLIQAARLTVDEFPDAKFILAGSKIDELDYFHECQQMVNDLGLEKHVEFPGHLSPDKALPDFDILACSSIADGQPLSILEAQATQIPVVATDVGDCRKLVLGSDGKPSGRLVGIGDARRFADALIELLADPVKRNRFGTTARSRAEAGFSDSEMVQAYRDIYDGFAGRIIGRIEEDSKNQSPLSIR